MASNPRIDDLRKRLEKEPNSRLFAQLAEELRKDGEFEEAIRIARAGLARHPAYPSARMTLGRALFDTGDLAAARQELESVLEGAPDNILASRLLAECLEGLGDLEGALGRYRATLALSPGDKQLTARVGDLEGRMQAVARPSPPPSAAAAPAQAPIPVATVDEPMELETSEERPPPAAQPAPIPLAAASAEFELETAYDAPGTQWQTGAAEPAASSPTVGQPQGARGAEAAGVPESIPTIATTAAFAEETIGETTLFYEPASTMEAERPARVPELEPLSPPVPAASAVPEPEGSLEYAFDMPGESAPPPAGPAPPASTPAVSPSMPPLPEPVAAVAPPLPLPVAPPPPAATAPPPLPPVVAPAPAPAPVAERDAPAAAGVASAVPTAPAPAATPVEGELVSPTLAELYFNQGFPEKAIEVYRRLLEREPGNERARARVAELQDLLAAPVTADPVAGAGEPGAGHRPSVDEQARAARRRALERTIERLESLRAALQKGSR